jgi:hypothetical protein
MKVGKHFDPVLRFFRELKLAAVVRAVTCGRLPTVMGLQIAFYFSASSRGAGRAMDVIFFPSV